MTTLPQYSAGAEGLPILGHLVFYSVSEEPVPHSNLMALVGQTQHILGRLPTSPPRDEDVFKRIASKAGLKKVPDPSDDTKSRNVLVRNVPQLVTPTRRIVVEEIVREAGTTRRLDYTQPTEVFLLQAGVQFRDYDVNAPAEAKELGDKVAQAIASDFASQRGCLDSNAIRHWIRQELSALHAIAIRRGIYFVPQKGEDALAEIDSILDQLPGSTTFHTLPLVDNAKQREMLENALVNDVEEAVEDMIGDVLEVAQKKRKLSDRGFKARVEEYAIITGKMETYKELLSKTLAETNARIALLDEAMDKLFAKAEADRGVKSDPTDEELEDLMDQLAEAADDTVESDSLSNTNP